MIAESNFGDRFAQISKNCYKVTKINKSMVYKSVVTSESQLGLSSGRESSFYWIRNRPGMGGPGVKIGPKWAAAGLGHRACSSRLYKYGSCKDVIPKATLLLVHL